MSAGDKEIASVSDARPPLAADAAQETPSTSSSSRTSTTPQQEDLRKKFQPLILPTRESLEQQDVMNNCGVKTVISGAMGGLFGIAFGLFTASLDNAGGGLEAVPVDSTKPTRVVLKEMALNMKNKSLSYAKGFAMVGSLYSFTECIIEKQRGKHDRWNPLLAGCATGGTLAVSAFSVAIEYFMDH